MDVIDELLVNHEAYAASLPVQHLDVRPRRRLAIVTCMDSRLDVFAALGLHHGEAHILRMEGPAALVAICVPARATGASLRSLSSGIRAEV